ncbi:RNA-dependent RNA polymerase 6 [Pyrus ussuriensis x Pyrus communis]|uniref:RNA-dependent RNA polymerase n=1 Tax=Pyrus ussuriensis x Pyrus communis TaxID=2448454 RepID=A0A5N5H7E8_9ROSA|nr:RNA-dependent RNA polymerase 6 [Pyrus ussuriensis x Pyrus communis]
MVNENLGAICNARMVHANLSDYGAMDENCLQLAKYTALAVDFTKTGKTVALPTHLKPKMYPDFMGKEEYQMHKSTKILGEMLMTKKWQPLQSRIMLPVTSHMIWIWRLMELPIL